MGEPNSFLKVSKPTRFSSFRLKKKRYEVKNQFVKNRRSGDFGYSLSSDVVSNTTADTLDPGLAATGDIQQNLRKLLRTKYRLNTEAVTEEETESGWGTWGRAGRLETMHSGDGDQDPEVKRNSLNFKGKQSRIGCFGRKSRYLFTKVNPVYIQSTTSFAADLCISQKMSPTAQSFDYSEKTGNKCKVKCGCRRRTCSQAGRKGWL